MQDRQDTKAQLNARLIHSYLRKHRAGVTKEAMLHHIGMEPREFDAAVRYSRRSENRELISNEIVAVTKGTPKLYFLAKSKNEADGYIDTRFAIIQGHLESVDILLSKMTEKWPEHARDIEFTQVGVRRNRDDINRLRMEIQRALGD
jgi:hypothetical protein